MRNNRQRKRNSKRTRDHLVSKDMGGTGSEDNIHWKKRAEHSGKHCYLGTKLFHKQLLQIIDENEITLKPEAIEIMNNFKLEIEKLMRDEKMYKENCFKYGKYPKR